MKIEADAGYIVRTGEPVCIAEVTASSTSVSVPSDPIADGEYLISLEVNGTVVAHRDTFTFASGSCTVGDYTVAYASNSVTVSTTDEDDVVRLMIEPVKAIVTDEFKAAVAKVAPKGNGGGQLPTPTAQDIGKVATVVEESGNPAWGMASGGGAGGGVLVVTADGTPPTLNKTWQEIHDSPVAVILNDAGNRLFVVQTAINGPTSYVVLASSGDGISSFVAQSASGYPTYTDK